MWLALHTLVWVSSPDRLLFFFQRFSPGKFDSRTIVCQLLFCRLSCNTTIFLHCKQFRFAIPDWCIFSLFLHLRSECISTNLLLFNLSRKYWCGNFWCGTPIMGGTPRKTSVLETNEDWLLYSTAKLVVSKSSTDYWTE